jgi:RNA polymerase sigma-70 factor (ECF subfamily)
MPPTPASVEPDDRVLIEAVIARRSELAARQLVDRHSPRLLAVVTRILGADGAAAEDVLQLSWIRGFDALPAFRGEARFSTWMTRIAVRGALEHLRRRRPAEESETSIELAAAPADDPDGRIDVEAAIARLPAGCRAVLILHAIEGFTHEEIGTTLGIAAGTSKAHLFRARQLMRRWLDPVIPQEARS